MSDYIDLWTDSATGQIAKRLQNVQTRQKSLADRQTRLDAQFDSVYQRYLAQFTRLQALQQQMSQTSSLFSTVTTN